MGDRRSERFGRYETLTELGRGAMGVVYQARDPKINRVVAVKTVSLEGQPPEEKREYRERFFREAEAAGRLSHPGIVTIFDVGEEAETHAPYIVMEFVRGQSLDKLLSRGDHKLPIEIALQLTLELAEALDCAHGQGVVHRDLKPANILVTEDGHAKIADFGVAKLNLANHTLAGHILGTPAYMSPEQLNGDAVDGRSDLFSLGVVLYTVLTGHRPFQGNSALTVSFKVVNHEPIPASVFESELPPGLDYIIARAMSKDPARRYQRGMEMVLDIQELREGREPWSKAKPPGSPTGGAARQTANARTMLSATGQLEVAAERGLSVGARILNHAAAKNLLQAKRNKPFAGALLAAGVLTFGLTVRHFVWPQRMPSPNLAGSRSAEPPPLAAEFPPVKGVAPPIVNATPQASPVRGTRLRPLNVARASSPTVSQATPQAMLEIEVDHKFAEAQLSIWVDDRLTYTHLLQGTDKKHLVVFHHVEGHELHAVPLSEGKHEVRVQVISGQTKYDPATVTGEFASGQEKVLRITFNKHGEINLRLQ
jgi:eukaryotic-like serine/threonine-protein kinase